MPLDRLVLILVAAIAAAGATIWLAVAVAAAATVHPVAVLIPATPFLLGAYVLLRVILGRLRDAEDNHYDRIER